MADSRGSARKRTPKFSPSWLIKYGLRATVADHEAQDVTSLSCRFCETFGRTGRADGDEGARKRKRTTRIMVFTPPWRTEHMNTHMTEQHGAHFAQYSSLGTVEKEAFFASTSASMAPLNEATLQTSLPVQLAMPNASNRAAEDVVSSYVAVSVLPSEIPSVPGDATSDLIAAMETPSVTSMATCEAPMNENSHANELLSSVQAYYSQHVQQPRQLPSSATVVPSSMHPRVEQILSGVPAHISSNFHGCDVAVPFGIRGLYVLDLGCGSGRDAYVASALVGPNGSVTGVEMADQQLEVAQSQVIPYTRHLGFPQPNLRFLKGYIECLDLAGIPAASTDLVLSNCVLNLSPFKEQVLQQVYRVLRTGGEFFFSDVFVSRRLSDDVRTHEAVQGERIGGALYVEDFKRLCRQVGYGEPRQLGFRPITFKNAELAGAVGMASFFVATYRCFKVSNMESGVAEEDYGQIATYNGSIAEHPFAYMLDADHTFEKGRPVRVGGNTAAILLESWLSRHFTVQGDRSVHFGQFSE